jgi:hypothetical protein
VQPHRKLHGISFKKFKIELSYDLVTPLLSIGIFALMYIEALFTIAKIQKQSKCPSPG